MSFSFEKRTIQQELATLRRKNTELEQEKARLEHVNHALTDALKQRGILVSVNGTAVTLSEPEQPKTPTPEDIKVPGVPPRASAKRPLPKKAGHPHEG